MTTRQRIIAIITPLPIIACLTICLLLFLGPSRKTNPQGLSCDAKLNALSFALESYKRDAGHYPLEGDGLGALLGTPFVDPDNDPLVDPWGRPFKLVVPGTHNPSGFDLWSVGVNGIDEAQDPASDDVRNWDTHR